jgi:CHAD domain-containing protein
MLWALRILALITTSAMSQPHDDRQSLSQLIQTATGDQLQRAMSLLSKNGPLEPTTIHETRKAIKRIRAALQLVRSDPGVPFGDWNGRLRDVSQTLSKARDLDVCRQTIEDLLPTVKSHRFVLERLHAELTEQRSNFPAAPHDDPRPGLVAALGGVTAEFSAWRAAHRDFRLIRPAVRRMAKHARRMIREWKETSHSDELHLLRKIVKRRLYWLEMLRPIWPRGLRAEEKLVDSLADRLGRHHDLEVLAEQLRTSAVAADAALNGSVQSLSRRLKLFQRKLEVRSLKLARRLFAERPQALARRWKTLVSIWQESPPQSNPQDNGVPAGELAAPNRPR